MSVAAKTAIYSFDDFCSLVQDGKKADLIGGVIYMASPDNTDANDLAWGLGTLMRLYARRKRLGRVLGSRVAMRLDFVNGPEPDILFIRKRRTQLIKRGYIDGPADLAVEIVSPDSIDRDYRDKRQQYEAAGIPEYWIVDPLMEKVTLLRLGQNDKYREVRAKAGALHSEVLAGFWVRPAWLWQRPFPDELELLEEILAS